MKDEKKNVIFEQWRAKAILRFLMFVCSLSLVYSAVLYIYELINPQTTNLHFLKEGGRNFFFLSSNIISYMIGKSDRKSDNVKQIENEN